MRIGSSIMCTSSAGWIMLAFRDVKCAFACSLDLDLVVTWYSSFFGVSASVPSLFVSVCVSVGVLYSLFIFSNFLLFCWFNNFRFSMALGEYFSWEYFSGMSAASGSSKFDGNLAVEGLNSNLWIFVKCACMSLPVCMCCNVAEQPSLSNCSIT